MNSAILSLPPKPEPPKDYDCCGGGCADCDLKLYLQRLAEWKKLAAQHSAYKPSVSDHVL